MIIPSNLSAARRRPRWAWLVTAHKSGMQKLTLVLYRLVQYQGQDYWREIESYQADIEVNVTIAQRLGSVDWKWIVGILITAMLIPAFWRWMDYRKKKKLQPDSKKADAKKNVVSRKQK